MFNPLEMFQAQGEAGIQAMAQQFGLSTEQTTRAFEALMPALTLGLQRGAGLDAGSFARMFGMPEAARSAAPQGWTPSVRCSAPPSCCRRCCGKPRRRAASAHRSSARCCR